MKLAAVEIRNFRCLRGVSIDCEAVTALVGPNGSGKSSVIRALEFFFAGARVDDQDCWGAERERTVSVALVFADLEPERAERYGPWLDSCGCLRIERRSEPSEAGRLARFVTTRLQHPDFAGVRQAATKSEALERYRTLCADDRFGDLPRVRSAAEAEAALAAWEEINPDLLKPFEDDAVGTGFITIERLADLIVVPAVRDASADAVETGGSPFRRLTELLIHDRSALDEPLESLERDTDEQYRAIVKEHGTPLIAMAERVIGARLDGLAPGAGVRLGWDQVPPTVSPPRMRAELVEAGFATEIGRQGHGVQRAYVLAVLQALADARQAPAGSAEGQPLAILAIEEPELYQHPLRARFLARVLSRLAAPGSATQVVYATHSPFFVSLDAVESLRLFRIPTGTGAPATTVTAVDLDTAAHELWVASETGGNPFTAETIKPRLRAMTETPVSEGFFARAVVLVEGEEDRAHLVAATRASDVDLEALGIAVLPVGGKSALDRPLLVFRQLAIPTYVVWDGDARNRDRGKDGHPADNRRLLALLGQPQVDYPTTEVQDTWACFEDCLAATARNEFGEDVFDGAVQEAADRLGVQKHREKNAVVLQEALQKLATAGYTSPTLAAIVARVRTLAQPGA